MRKATQDLGNPQNRQTHRAPAPRDQERPQSPKPGESRLHHESSPHPVPSESDIAKILEETLGTLFLTISRQACGLLNGFALEAVFAEATPLAVVPADPESNVDNYEHGKKLRDVPAEVPIYIGMKVVLTKNLNKGIGFVNGMAATVLGMDGGNIIVKKDRGRRLAVHPWTSEDKVVRFPLRVGYALSRAQRDEEWRFVGDPGIHHFTPAQFH